MNHIAARAYLRGMPRLNATAQPGAPAASLRSAAVAGEPQAVGRQLATMSFDPLSLFTSVGTLTSVWLIAAVGVFSLLGAWRAFRRSDRFRFLRSALGAFLTLLCAACCLILVGWLMSPHV